MTARQTWSDSDLEKIWIDKHGYSSLAYCPYQFCGFKQTLMQKNDYGNHSHTSWVVDHKKPISKGGSDNIENLRPLHNWCNQSKGDDY